MKRSNYSQIISNEQIILKALVLTHIVIRVFLSEEEDETWLPIFFTFDFHDFIIFMTSYWEFLPTSKDKSELIVS